MKIHTIHQLNSAVNVGTLHSIRLNCVYMTLEKFELLPYCDRRPHVHVNTIVRL